MSVNEPNPVFPFLSDPAFDSWKQRVATLSSSAISIRDAAAVPEDGLAVRYLQFTCSPIGIGSVDRNVQMIADRRVLLAEVDGVPVGFCVSISGTRRSDPLFLQLLGVAPEARGRGIGLALFAAGAHPHPNRDIALATQEDNLAARAVSERFASSIGASIRRVPLGTYRDRDLSITRGLGYRCWVIERPRS